MTRDSATCSPAGLDFDDRHPQPLARTPLPFGFSGEEFVADPSGALYWPSQDTLVVADLLIAEAGRNANFPPTDIHDAKATLNRLQLVLERLDPYRVIVLGSVTQGRVGDDEIASLHNLQEGRDWYWITGEGASHHTHAPELFGGRSVPGVTLQRIRFCAAPSGSRDSREIAGSFHPVIRLIRHGEPVRRKCFVAGDTSLLVPAFGAYAGGQNIHDMNLPGITAGGDMRILMLGREGVSTVERSQLLPDPDPDLTP